LGFSNHVGGIFLAFESVVGHVTTRERVQRQRIEEQDNIQLILQTFPSGSQTHP